MVNGENVFLKCILKIKIIRNKWLFTIFWSAHDNNIVHVHYDWRDVLYYRYWHMSNLKHLHQYSHFHSRKKYRLWKSMGAANCLITNIFQNIFFCVKQKKETHTVLEQLEGEEIITIFIFGWTIPLRMMILYEYGTWSTGFISWLSFVVYNKLECL